MEPHIRGEIEKGRLGKGKKRRKKVEEKLITRSLNSDGGVIASSALCQRVKVPTDNLIKVGIKDEAPFLISLSLSPIVCIFLLSLSLSVDIPIRLCCFTYAVCEQQTSRSSRTSFSFPPGARRKYLISIYETEGKAPPPPSSSFGARHDHNIRIRHEKGDETKARSFSFPFLSFFAVGPHKSRVPFSQCAPLLIVLGPTVIALVVR